jgi:amidase
VNDDLCDRPAHELAALLQRGSVSARELLDIHLRRIEAVNPTVNAVVTLVPELAMARAKELDDALLADGPVGPLHGLPMAHKDLAETAGIRTTFGSPLFADNVPERDALIVARMRQAGGVTLGKTNTPEFGAGSHTFNRVFGPTANPWDTSLTCGGSSGGAAVALACGMVALADGSDTGGSLRNPAAFCNVVGLRPSPGRVPNTISLAAWSPLSTEGPMGRTVADVALLLSAIAGGDLRAPMSLATPGTDFAKRLDQDVRGMRIAWSDDLGGLPVDSAITAALKPARQTLEDLGCIVMDTFPDLSNAREIFQTLRAWGFELGLGPLYDRAGDELKETVRWNIEEARRRSLADHADASRRQTELYRRVVDFMADVDYLACPVTQVPPFPLDQEWVTEINGVPMETYVDWMRACSDITVTALPAISVPGGFTDTGLPVGLQLVGRPRADWSVLGLAHAFERATGFHQRRPPVLEDTP